MPHVNTTHQENNDCGDLEKTDDPSGGGAPIAYNARYNFKDLNTGPGYATRPIYNLACGDAANGVLNISTCVGYDQNSTSTSCNNLNEAIPGAPSKCRCQGPPSFQSNIPVPNLALQCGCAVANGVVNCDVTYTNTGLGTCTQTSNVAETEFACGTARYVRFRTTYPHLEGDISALNTCIPTTSGTTTANCTAGPGFGAAVDNTTGTITWTPESDNGLGSGTSGWIGANESERMRFSFTQTTTGPLNVSFPTIAQWDNDGDFSSGAVDQTALSCSVSATTPVTLETFEARPDGDEIELSWSTATEAGNAGFNVYAETRRGSIRLNDRLVPSRVVDSLAPQSYRLVVPAAGLEKARFFIEDVNTRGVAERHGPFTAGVRHGRAGEVTRTDWAAIQDSHARTAARNERAEARLAMISGRSERGERGARQGDASAGTAAAPPSPGPKVWPRAELLVRQSGIQRVTHEALVAAGANFDGAKAADLVLESGDAAVPMTVSAGRLFGAGSYIEFLGSALDTLYTDANVYRLRVDRRGLRAGVDATAPSATVPAATHYLETARVENEAAYSFSAPNGDPWFDRYLANFGGPTETNLDAAVSHYVAGAAPVRLEVGLWGATDWNATPDHHVQVLFNGASVADEIFDGMVDYPISATLPEGVLQAGANVLTIRQPGDMGVAYDFLALDSYAVTYPRALVANSDRLRFDGSAGRYVVNELSSSDVVAYRDDAAGPQRLAGVTVSGGGGSYSVNLPGAAATATYHVSTVAALHHPAIRAGRDGAAILTGAADYLIISHPDFAGDLGALVARRQSQGHAVKVVDVRDVYAQFSGGVFDPYAIRDFIAHSTANLGARLVLLVGGDSYDYRGYGGSGAISFIPSLYAPTGPYVSFAPVDPLFGEFQGDGVPDVAVGRFPVRTTAELEQMISSTLAYESKGYQRTAVFAADGFDGASLTGFSGLSDGFAAGLAGDWEVERAYIDLDGVAGAKLKLINAINGGVALASYIGHSGPAAWTFQGLFRNSDAAALENSGAPTVVSQYGCWNAYYVSPTHDSLAHRLLLSGDRGAAAVLGATTLTEVSSDREFGYLLTPKLSEPGKSIGAAVLEAKWALAANHPEMVDVLLGFTILGDPALGIEP